MQSARRRGSVNNIPLCVSVQRSCRLRRHPPHHTAAGLVVLCYPDQTHSTCPRSYESVRLHSSLEALPAISWSKPLRFFLVATLCTRTRMRCYGYYRDHSLANVQQAYLLENMHVYKPVTCIQHIIQIIYSFNIVTAQPGKLLVTPSQHGVTVADSFKRIVYVLGPEIHIVLLHNWCAAPL